MSPVKSLEEMKLQLVDQLISTNCLKFGQFKLKTGDLSDYYVDLREATMYPKLFDLLVKLVNETLGPDKLQSRDSQPVAIVGVPYGVVPLAAAVAYNNGLAYYPVRKEVKNYGHKPDSKGFNNFEFILIEDVMSSGSSIVETIKKMEGKKITDLVILVNREQGGDQLLTKEFPDIKVHYLLKASFILTQAKQATN